MAILKKWADKSIKRAKRPEAVGVSSLELSALVNDFLRSGLEIHSLMVMRRGKVAFEAFRAPYTPEMPHAMFSVSKSITSLAAGFAISEGLLALETPVLEILPELRGYVPEEPDEQLERLTLRQLLAMTSGKSVPPMADKRKNRWLRDFAEAPWRYPPGEGWNYHNENCHVVCAMLQRVSGMTVVDYLMPRLFEPLGIPRPFWETDGNGVEAGGWGISLTTESFAKIMLCCQQGGVYQGRQVIPADYIQEATRRQTESGGASAHGKVGYGLCFWMDLLPGSYRAEGVFSQLGLVFPDQGACLVMTGGEIFSADSLDCLFRHIPQLFLDENGPKPERVIDPADIRLPPLPELPRAPRSISLEQKLEGRIIRFSQQGPQSLPQALGYPVSVMPVAVFFMSAEKGGGINDLRFRFQTDTLQFSWSEGSERNTVLCGMDGRARRSLIRLGGMDFTVGCTAAWEGASRLHVWLRPLESVAQRRLTFIFSGSVVRMLPRSSPGLSSIGKYLTGYISTLLPSALGGLMASQASKLAQLAEPMHIGTVTKLK
ncbi:MAG: beta-lactamase family protein [Oscillospiraceae bacterium]|nr:beta-lactamase family protein [Oscillospiraceae bacterium]